MPKFRISANLCWDYTGTDKEAVEKESLKHLVKALEEMAKSGFVARKPKVSVSKLKNNPVSDIAPKVVLAEFPPEEVFSRLTTDGTRQDFSVGENIYKVKMNSQRYFVLRENPFCVACGIKGTKCLLELPKDCRWPHFNLYAEVDNKLILMTKDHKIPVARDGKNTMDNFQTMCAICNNIKGKDFISLKHLKELRELHNKCFAEGKNSTTTYRTIEECKVKLLKSSSDPKETEWVDAAILHHQDELVSVPIQKPEPEALSKLNWRKLWICFIIGLMDLAILYCGPWYLGAIALIMAILGILVGMMR